MTNETTDVAPSCLQSQPGEPRWAQFRRSPRWIGLTPQQRRWVAIYLSTSDSILATRVAYKCSSDKNAKVLSYQIRKSHNVVAALNEFLDRSPLEILLEEVESHLQHAEPGSVAAQRLLAQKERLILGIAPQEVADGRAPKPIGRPRTHFVAGNIVTQEQKGVRVKFRVTQVDGAGKILAAEEIQ